MRKKGNNIVVGHLICISFVIHVAKTRSLNPRSPVHRGLSRDRVMCILNYIADDDDDDGDGDDHDTNTTTTWMCLSWKHTTQTQYDVIMDKPTEDLYMHVSSSSNFHQKATFASPQKKLYDFAFTVLSRKPPSLPRKAAFIPLEWLSTLRIYYTRCSCLSDITLFP